MIIEEESDRQCTERYRKAIERVRREVSMQNEVIEKREREYEIINRKDLNTKESQWTNWINFGIVLGRAHFERERERVMEER